MDEFPECGILIRAGPYFACIFSEFCIIGISMDWNSQNKNIIIEDLQRASSRAISIASEI